MQITEVRVVVTCPGRNYVAVKVLTDDPGLYGVGDATLNGRELAVAAALEHHIAPLLIGRDPDRVEDIWQYLHRGTYWRGGPVLMTALAGIDLALWDIKGKRAGLPLYSLLGGRCRDGALAYAHASGRDAAEVEAHAQTLIDRGFKAVRIQVGIQGRGLRGAYGVANQPARPGFPAEEIWEPGPYLRAIPPLFERLRASLGEEVELLHDVHERLTPIEAAARLAKELEPAHLFFLEDCLRPEHKESFRLIRRHTTTTLAMGELYHSKWECLPVIVEQLIDFSAATSATSAVSPRRARSPPSPSRTASRPPGTGPATSAPPPTPPTSISTWRSRTSGSRRPSRFPRRSTRRCPAPRSSATGTSTSPRRRASAST